MRCTISWSLLATVHLSRDEDGIGWSDLLLKFALECLYAYYAPTLLRSRLHLVRDTAAEKEFDICNICINRWHCHEHVSAEIQENKKGRKN